MAPQRMISCIPALLLTAAGLLSAVGCGTHGRVSSDARAKEKVPASGVCDLIDVPRNTMMEGGTTFTDVVEDSAGRKADRGVSAAVAFGVLARGEKSAGRFRSVIHYLSQRAMAQTSEPPAPAPKATPAIRANARALDRFIADGGCG